MKTGTIRYNVRERGRKFRGQERNFDTAALAELVNGPEVQERVKNRDLVGYFGHWPRIVFGMNPGEGGIYQGKHIPLEAAIVTTKLRADPDGTIEHETEFLDTAPGRTAKRLFGSKSGGFSSAINCREYGGKDVPLGFHGFDYVMEPNFTTNRGYALDGVFGEGVPGSDALLDSAIGDSQAAVKVLDGLYTALQGDYDRLAAVVARQQQEIEEYATMLAARGPEAVAGAKAVLARLDSVYKPRAVGVAPRGVSKLEKLAADFADMPLADLQPSPRPVSQVSQQLSGLLDVGMRGLLGK